MITYKEFIKTYNPIDNDFDPAAPMEGKLYDVIEFSRIAPYALRSRLLWTVVKEDFFDTNSREYTTKTRIYPGCISKPVVQGYMVTTEPYKYGADIVVEL
jgi:hypothetical protein